MAWAATVELDDLLLLDEDYEFFKVSSEVAIITLNPRELLSLQFNTMWDGAGTDDIIIKILSGMQISTGNTLDGKTTDLDVELDTAADPIAADDDLNGRWLIMVTSGTARGEGRQIVASVAADDGVNLTHAMTDPDTGDPYALWRFGTIQSFTIDLANPAKDIDLAPPTLIMGPKTIAIMARMDGGSDTPDLACAYELDQVSV